MPATGSAGWRCWGCYVANGMESCDSCGKRVGYEVLRNANEYGYLCPACYQKWLKGEPPFDEG
jgi:hypothetical protein